MSTFQLDEDDAPLITHVDMGKIMPPRTGSKVSDTHQHKGADANRQTNGPTDDGKPDGAQPSDSQQGDGQPDNAQTDSSQQGRT